MPLVLFRRRGGSGSVCAIIRRCRRSGGCVCRRSVLVRVGSDAAGRGFVHDCIDGERAGVHRREVRARRRAVLVRRGRQRRVRRERREVARSGEARHDVLHVGLGDHNVPVDTADERPLEAVHLGQWEPRGAGEVAVARDAVVVRLGGDEDGDEEHAVDHERGEREARALAEAQHEGHGLQAGDRVDGPCAVAHAPLDLREIELRQGLGVEPRQRLRVGVRVALHKALRVQRNRDAAAAADLRRVVRGEAFEALQDQAAGFAVRRRHPFSWNVLVLTNKAKCVV
mmetsp:Transcript_49534/g.152870  ORF Transcript_49534/g.152870 Transcript_49534/m.152870 type:complete len:284 (-) Transcript_49534:243-1094(-)